MIQNCSYFFSSFIHYKLYSLTGIFIAVAIVIYLYFNVKKTFLAFIAYSLFLTGTIFNAVDRYLDGCVIDNLDFFGLFKNNIFDYMICISATILAYLLLKTPSKEIIRR